MTDHLLDAGAPPPLAALTSRVTSPNNEALVARHKRAEVLSRRQIRKVSKAIMSIRAELAENGYEALLVLRDNLREELAPLHEQYHALKAHLSNNPDDADSCQQYKSVRKAIKPKLERYQSVTSTLRPLYEKAQQLEALQNMLDDHPIAVARMKKEAELRKALEREAEIYARLIQNTWTRLGMCHRYTDKKGREKVDRVRFSNMAITLDGIHFKILTSSKTIWNNWKDHIPQGVYVESQLLSPQTLRECSIACQRQVTGVSTNDGAWVIVHRLESVDGLMNEVGWDSVMERYPDHDHDGMPIPLGVTYNREVVWITLEEVPHWLVGGYTKSGKSNFINSSICALISNQPPDDLRLILIDLKGGVEFDFYKDIPHLHNDIIQDVGDIPQVLAEAEALMIERQQILKKANVKLIEDYNRKRPHDRMPRVLIVFDEVASYIGLGETTRRITASLTTLVRIGRNVGIHVWLCTQRPDVQVITGAIKANMGMRASGRMQTTADSMTILGNGTAAALPDIKGRMVFQLGPEPFVAQTPHIHDDTLMSAVARAKQFSKPAPLVIPDIAVTDLVWSPQRVIEISLVHLGGEITWKAIYEAAAGDLSANQARELVKRIWDMDLIEHNGNKYKVVVGRSNKRRLELIEPEKVLDL